MIRFWPAMVSLAALLLAGCLDLSANDSRNTTMDKAGWKTHCFGRYLVDLPPDAQVNAKYKLRNNEIVLLKGYDSHMLKADLDKREAELKLQKHNTQGSMFVQRASHANDSQTIVSWIRPTYDKMYWAEARLVYREPYRAYQYDGKVATDRLAVGLTAREKLARSLRPRADNEIPKESGFCIEGGYIAGNEWMDETVRVSVGFPKHPGVDFGISIFAVGKPDKPLLERMGGTMSDLLGKFAGLKMLRKGKRPVGPVDADEIATAANEKGQRLYAFAWEAPGKPKSNEFPNINVELGVLEQTPPPQTPPFKNDAEALELWDAIIDSIRLRPGAV